MHASLLYLKELAERAQSGFGSSDNTNLDAISVAANTAIVDGGRDHVLGLHLSGGMLPVVRESLAYNQYEGGGRDDMALRAMIYGENLNEFKQPTDTAMEDGGRGGISHGGGSGDGAGSSDSEGDQPPPFLRPFPPSNERLSSVDVIRSYFPTSNTPFAGPREAENTFSSFPNDRGGLGIGYRSSTFSSHPLTFPVDRNSDILRLTSTSSPQGIAGIEPPSLGRQSTADLFNDMYHLLDADSVRR